MAQGKQPRWLDSYYFGFEPTGCDPVDAILEAVARAGKGYHHTESWADSYDGNPSYVDKIQSAANEAAAAFGQPLPSPPKE